MTESIQPKIRAAGCCTAKGVEMTASTIKAFMLAHKIGYFTAAGQVMITRDEIWSEAEHAAFKEAFEILNHTA